MLSVLMPHLAWWQWTLGSLAAYMIGIAKTGAPGVTSLMVPLMVLTVGDARLAAGWTLPTLATADVFAVIYWRRHADAKKLFSMFPWTLAGMAGGAIALSLSEPIIRRLIAGILLLMLAIQIRRKWECRRPPRAAPRFMASWPASPPPSPTRLDQ